jgi:hypothetical protein
MAMTSCTSSDSNKVKVNTTGNGCLTISKASYTYDFTIRDLYPIESERASLDGHRFKVDGVILDENFNEGAMKVKTVDGEERDIQFSPSSTSSAVASNLRIAVKPGNQIRSICARAGASTVDLVSATITSNTN